MESTADNDEAESVALRTSPELERQLEAVAESVGDEATCLVASHEEPDGDAMGSTLAMALLLEQLGHEVVRFNQDPVPYNFEFLEGADDVVSEVPADLDVELVVLLDCSTVDRLGEAFPGLGAFDPDTTVIIDHHTTIDRSTGDLYLYDEQAAATGELIYRLAEQTGTTITTPLAECLYCALITDTGSFQYSNTSRTTFRIAGELLDAGVDAWKMTAHLYESEPLERIELLSEVLETLRLSPCGRLAFIRIDRDTIGETDRLAELTDGFINYGRSIRGVEVSTQLREREDESWKVSFRSVGNIDVSRLASAFGGGGHDNAAGCVIEGNPDDIERDLTRALTDILDE